MFKCFLSLKLILGVVCGFGFDWVFLEYLLGVLVMGFKLVWSDGGKEGFRRNSFDLDLWNFFELGI